MSHDHDPVEAAVKLVDVRSSGPMDGAPDATEELKAYVNCLEGVEGFVLLSVGRPVANPFDPAEAASLGAIRVSVNSCNAGPILMQLCVGAVESLGGKTVTLGGKMPEKADRNKLKELLDGWEKEH